MTDPKKSTNDILAKIRAQSAGATSESAAEKPAADSGTNQPAENTASSAPAAAAAGGSPADIMASIRKQGAGNAAASQDGGQSSPAAAPKGTSSILDAIRGGGAPAAGAAAAKPKAAAAAAKKPAVDPSAAGGLSAAEMIKAARSGPVAGAESPTATPALPLPKKPLAKKSAVARPKAEAVPRRSFLGRTFAAVTSPIVVAWTSFIVMTSTSLLALARFMMPNVLVEPPTKFKIGPPSDYAPGTVSTKWQAQFAIWVVNGEIDGEQMIYALSTVCTHLGCTPNWLEGEQKFKCPCHGSGFYKTGVNFEGPAPRPLERMGIRLAEDGMLEVDKSVKFQQELGQWANPASFVPVA
jgi:cytochrome b6-f complex iron-sulfur subunit